MNLGNGRYRIRREQPHVRAIVLQRYALEIERDVLAVLLDRENVLTVGLGIIGGVTLRISAEAQYAEVAIGVEDGFKLAGKLGTLLVTVRPG